MSEPRSQNIKYHPRLVSLTEREVRNHHRGAILWFTGLSGSGKSTVATRLDRTLFLRANQTFVLDGDNVRYRLNRDLGFSPEDRTENIRRIGEVANLFREAGIIVLTAFISPYRQDREQVRGLTPAGRFIEIFVDCPLEECERRDPKGLYKKARAGEIRDFTGISAPYEAPSAPEITINTATCSVEECVEQILRELRKLDILNPVEVSYSI